MIEKLILEIISRLVKDKKAIRSMQHGFIKAKSHLTNPLNFYNDLAGLVDERRAVEIVCFAFSKAFYNASQNILIDKPLIYGLGKQAMGCIENCPDGWAQRGVTSLVQGQ